MSDSSQSRIAAIEAEIDALETAVEGCRKTVQVGRALFMAGPVLVLVGAWNAHGLLFVTGVTAALGGFVLAGSTEATRRKHLARLAELDEERAALIGDLSMTVVP